MSEGANMAIATGSCRHPRRLVVTRVIRPQSKPSAQPASVVVVDSTVNEQEPQTPQHRDSQVPPDLAVIEADLAAVETALQRLDKGTYWADSITGAPLSDELLAVNPVATQAS